LEVPENLPDDALSEQSNATLHIRKNFLSLSSADLEDARAYLMRFARLQLRNEAWAEDAVAETLLAAVQRPDAFEGRSSRNTWLVGILRNKIVDQIRLHTRECSLATDDDRLDIEDEVFGADGHFSERPSEWGRPESELREKQFLTVMEACVERLPDQQGRVFLMKEWLELDSDTICKEIDIQPTNLWVLLHRARLRLRECLQQMWFDSAMSAT
jgi:RNA polymerase sigma-70 factor (ECF subfamily)